MKRENLKFFHCYTQILGLIDRWLHMINFEMRVLIESLLSNFSFQPNYLVFNQTTEAFKNAVEEEEKIWQWKP